MAKKIENHFGYWPVTTPLESCFWAWSKLEPESTSATPYLNAKGLGGPVKGSFFTGTVVALSGLKTGLESARTKGNKMTRQALKIKCILILSSVFQRLFFTFHMIQAEFEINWFVYVQQNSSSRDELSRSTTHARDLAGTSTFFARKNLTGVTAHKKNEKRVFYDHFCG